MGLLEQEHVPKNWTMRIEKFGGRCSFREGSFFCPKLVKNEEKQVNVKMYTRNNKEGGKENEDEQVKRLENQVRKRY